MTEVNFRFSGDLSLVLQMSQVPRVGDHVKFFVGTKGFTETKAIAVVWLISDEMLDDQADVVSIDLEWLAGLSIVELGERYGEEEGD